MTTISSPGTSNRRQAQGIALVLVLSFLVLLSALIVAFFGNVSNEMIASKSFSASVTTRQLAETTTNFVMGQLSDATSGFVDPKDLDSPILAWASQPGMVRTYRDNGLPYRYYKLYSSKSMVLSDPAESYNVNEEFAADLPTNWHQQPGAFTDLNAPIKGPNSVYEYPIVDPTVQRTASTGVSNGVDGFEIMKGPGFSGSETRVAVTDDTAATPQSNPAMMPARWIYVLRDGTLSPAPDPKGDVLSWSAQSDTASRPNKENPIVGRIAFWTDDETAKVNINTASEGTFWDRPWSRSSPDTNLATYIPAQGEYQRYAGHPAMTCLSPILSSVIPVSPDKSQDDWLVPRTMSGGTKAGTDNSYAQSTGGMGSDNERLFAAVDELAFGPLISGGAVGSFARTFPTTTVLNAAKAREFGELVRRSRFFLTVSNRAPDVNLFNRPRVSLWPLQLAPAERNVKDKLIAFCGSTSYGLPTEARYYFQRFNSYSLNKSRYGDGRTAFTSTNGPFPSSCHPTLDWTNVPRNQELYAYLQDLTKRDIPGFGSNLKAKWDAGLPPAVSERDQILTQSLDYIRSQVNSYSTSNSLTPFYDYAPTRNGGPVAGETQIIPLRIPTNNTQGFGRYSTVTEVAIVFQRVQVSGTEQRLRAFLILEPFNPSPGPASWSPHVRYVVKGLEKLRVGGSAFGDTPTDIGFPPPSNGVYPSNWTTARVGYAGGGHKLAFMGLQASFRFFQNNPDPPKVYGTSGAENTYPFATPNGAVIRDFAAGKTFKLSGEDGVSGLDLEVEIYSGFENVPAGRSPNPALLVQRLNLTFPPVGNLPLPTIDNTTFNARVAADAYLKSSDVVRSVEISKTAAGGDLRYVCALPQVPKEFFGVSPKYGTPQAIVHTLRSNGLGSTGYDTSSNPILVPGASYDTGVPGGAPAAAAYVTAATNVSGQGDFDNAPGDWADGAYINKADEGNISTGADSWFSSGSFNVEDGRTFSPNRQIASAITFGSLPTGIKATELAVRTGAANLSRPWQTLLFNPHPSSRTSLPTFNAVTGKHPGFGTTRNNQKNQPPYVTPPDHLFLDLFTMPIVEPYAISEPFSTQGRVNLNYQIAPYTYIKRTTGLQSVLKSVRMSAIPTTSGNKSAAQRYDIDPSVGADLDGAKLDPTKGTLYGFQQKFNDGDIFRSASQICDISLIPKNAANYGTIDTFWTANKRTGDNVREIPYGHIYPRVTTKSNTFTVHMRVQALRKSTATGADEWKEGVDQVAGEYRGSATLERYIEAANPALPDFAKPGIKDNLDRHYRFRILNTKAFVR